MTELEKTLRRALPSELASAVDEIPGLVVPVLVCFALIECIPRSNFLEEFPPVSFHVLAACLSALIGVIVYSLGDYWDRKWFNPRYGPKGRWIESSSPLFFPSASELSEARKQAAKSLLSGDRLESQRGVYSQARDLIQDRGRWGEVLGAVVVSKFVRSFIWPNLLACVVLLVVALVRIPMSLDASVAFVMAATCLLTALASFPAYAKFRVKHMEQVYRLATRLQGPSAEGAAQLVTAADGATRRS